MKKYNNRIITISGDPASGKGSVTKALKELYESQGIKVHIISVGDRYREIVVGEYKKKFPEVENPSLKQIYSDPNFSEELREIDYKIDNEIIPQIAMDINSEPRPNEVFFIDSRVAWLKIPEAFAVQLIVDAKTAGKRVFNDKTRGPEEQYASEEEAIKGTAFRREKDIQRFLSEYKADITDINNFKMVICTTLANVYDIARAIQICEERYRENKPYTKTWASPELFYSTQDISRTLSKSKLITKGLNIKELAESIKKNGIYPDDPVLSITISNSPYQFLAKGHHRNFACIMAGQTLIPYTAIKNVDKATVSSQRKLSEIYDHEDLVTRPDGSAFRYAEYPEIDERSEELEYVY